METGRPCFRICKLSSCFFVRLFVAVKFRTSFYLPEMSPRRHTLVSLAKEILRAHRATRSVAMFVLIPDNLIHDSYLCFLDCELEVHFLARNPRLGFLVGEVCLLLHLLEIIPTLGTYFLDFKFKFFQSNQSFL